MTIKKLIKMLQSAKNKNGKVFINGKCEDENTTFNFAYDGIEDLDIYVSTNYQALK